MLIEHKRTYNTIKKDGRAYCISHIYVDGKYMCDAIEDYDRGLDESMSETHISRLKVYKRTAIPTGRYRVKMNVVSGTFVQKSYYKNFCQGKVPRLDPVKGFSGILIHRGVNENSSAGCVIVGFNTIVGAVNNSQIAFERLYKVMKEAYVRGEQIEWLITRTYKAISA